MSWFEDTFGIDGEDLGNIFTGVGTVLQLWDDYDRTQVDKRSAQFTRQRQIFDLTAFISNQRRMNQINAARKQWMEGSQRTVLEGQLAYARTERDYWRDRGHAELEMGRELAADDALARSLDFDQQAAALSVRGAQVRASRLSLGHERAGNELRQAQALAQRDAIEAERSLLGVETAERGRILAARQQAVVAGVEAVQARQAEVAGVLRSRVGARREQLQMETGAIAAGAASRGLSGSFEGTATAQAGREAGREILELGLGAASDLAQLGERQAGLMLEGQRIRSEAAIGAARDESEYARLDADRMGALARGEELRAEGAELAGREGVLAAQEAQLGVERMAIASGRQMSERQYGRDIRRTALDARQTGLRSAGAQLDLTRAQADLADLDLDVSALGAEITSGSTALAIANWTLEQAPELPDYDTYFFRGALGTLLGSGSEAWT